MTVFKEECLLRWAHFVSPLVFSITYVPAEYLEEYKGGLEHAQGGVSSQVAPPPK